MRGLQSGLERITKIMIIALLVIMVVLAINSFFMPGAKEGLRFYLLPDFGRMKDVGVMNTLAAADDVFEHGQNRRKCCERHEQEEQASPQSAHRHVREDIRQRDEDQAWS